MGTEGQIQQKKKKWDWINIPNALTTIRILLCPALLYTFFRADPEGQARMWVLLCLFLASGLTDCLDGFAARKLNQITTLGKVLDPLADKLFTVSVLLCLTIEGVVPLWVLIVLVVKELYMVLGGIILLKNHIEVASDIYGKVATIVFYPAVILAWPWHGIDWLSKIGDALIMLSVALSILAAVHYTVCSVKTLKERKKR